MRLHGGDEASARSLTANQWQSPELHAGAQRCSARRRRPRRTSLRRDLTPPPRPDPPRAEPSFSDPPGEEETWPPRKAGSDTRTTPGRSSTGSAPPGLAGLAGIKGEDVSRLEGGRPCGSGGGWRGSVALTLTFLSSFFLVLTRVRHTLPVPPGRKRLPFMCSQAVH